MTNAICISCGAKKRAPYKKCNHCGLDPKEDDSILVKSVYLSIGRFELEDVRKKQEYSIELDNIAQLLQRGQKIEYDEKELVRLQKDLLLMRSVPRRVVYGALIRLFFPALVIGVLFLIIIFLLQRR